MPLIPPALPAWVTDCSTVIRVSNVFPGATVEVLYADDTVVARLVGATSVVVDVPVLIPKLTVGKELKVRQGIPPDSGYAGPLDGVVSLSLSPPSPPLLKSAVHRCSRCLLLEGMSAGHTASVYVNLSPAGSALAFGPKVQVGLSVGAQGTVGLMATHCVKPPPVTSSLPYAPVTTPALPAPNIDGPLIDCATEIPLSGIVAGSIVTVFRTNQPPISFCAPTDGRLVVPPLQAGQVVWAVARMEACEGLRTRSSPPSYQVTVVDARPPTPVVIPPCPGTRTLYISNLMRNALVLVSYETETYSTFVGSGSTLIFHLPAEKTFVEGSAVTVTQSLCASKFSDPPATVKVRHGAQTAFPLGFPFPLLAGATLVRVENVGLWGRLELWSQKFGRLNVIEPTTSSVVDVVVPSLVQGDTIEARFTQCGKMVTTLEGVFRKEPTPPTIVATLCGQRVVVGNVLPGSTVYLFVNKIPITPLTTASDTAEFELAQLALGDWIDAFYVLDGKKSSGATSQVVVGGSGGAWTILSKTFEIPGDPDRSFLPVHAALLSDPLDAKTYRVLLFAGSQLDERFHLLGQEEALTQQAPPHWNATRIWWPYNGGTIGFVGNGLPYDAFCAGQCMLGDGSVLVVGGSRYYSLEAVDNVHLLHFVGVRDCARFDPVTLLWEKAADLNLDPQNTPETGGRWYPTVVTLADGTALTAAGHPDLGAEEEHTNNTVEHFVGSPASGTWVITTPKLFTDVVAGDDKNPQYYPEIFVLPSESTSNPKMLVISYGYLSRGAVWLSSGLPSGELSTQPDPTQASTTYRLNPLRGTSVLLPLRADTGYHAWVLAIGATLVKDVNTSEPKDSSWHTLLFDLGTAITTTYSMSVVASPKNPQRWYGMATLLADGTLLYHGGVGDRLDNFSAIFDAEIYDPSSGKWTPVLGSTIVRNYHSVSILLPDGRVWVGGSNRNSAASYNSVTATAPKPPRANVDADWTQAEEREFRAETFSPPYLCILPRPSITWNGPPPQLTYGATFAIPTPDLTLVAHVSMLRHGTSTHAFDPDQRCVFPSAKKINGALEVTMPPDGTVAPPGYFTLFLLGTNGSVSSPGLVVRLG